MRRLNKILETSEYASTSVFLFISGGFKYHPMSETLPKIIQKKSFSSSDLRDFEKEYL